jgi:hypothetical protein
VNPGAVEAIAEHPTLEDKILIGYNRGLMVLWDKSMTQASKVRHQFSTFFLLAFLSYARVNHFIYIYIFFFRFKKLLIEPSLISISTPSCLIRVLVVRYNGLIIPDNHLTYLYF